MLLTELTQTVHDTPTVNHEHQTPYEHQTVNHEENFVDPLTGATTNHVECFWKNMKRKLKAMSGTNTNMLPSHLDEFMWRQLRGEDAFVHILQDIAEQYPLP